MKFRHMSLEGARASASAVYICTPKHHGMSDIYSIAGGGFSHWKGLRSNSGWLHWTRRTTHAFNS